MKLPLVATIALLGLVTAHGPPASAAELAKREHAHLHARRAFSSCHNTLRKRDSDDPAIKRRSEFVRRYQHAKRSQQGILPRQQTATATRTQKNVATGTNTADPFKGAIPTCVLAPESAQGPYYLPNELIRNDIRESQPGIDLLLDIQVFDAKTCKTLPNVMMDFWHCNATGTYSGYEVEGTSNLSWLRGAVESGKDGIIQVTTKFPGHYADRAIHIHIMAHMNGTTETDNNGGKKYSGGRRPYTGQLYFPMDVVDSVEKVDPYTQNKNTLIRNEDDNLFQRRSKEVAGFDGLFKVERLGDKIEDGLLAYISVGIDPSRNDDTDSSRNDNDGSGQVSGSPTGGSDSGNSSATTSTTSSADATVTAGGQQGRSGTAGSLGDVTMGKVLVAVLGGIFVAAAVWA